MIKAINNYYIQIKSLLGGNTKALPKILFFFILSSTVEILGLSIVIPYMGVILNYENLNTASIYGFDFSNLTKKELIVFLSIFLVITYIFKSVVSIAVKTYILKYSYKVAFDLRLYLMELFLNTKYKQFKKKKMSDFVYILENLTGDFHSNLKSLLMLISDGIIFAAIIIVLGMKNFLVLFFALLFVAFVFIFLDIYFKKKLKIFGIKVNIHANEMIQNILDAVRGFKVIKILGKEKFFLNRLKENVKIFTNIRIKLGIIQLLPKHIFETLFIILICGSVVVSFELDFSVNEFLVTLTFFSAASVRLIPCANSISTNFSELRFKRNSINILFNNLKLIESYERDEKNSEILKFTPFEKLKFEDVSFSYNDSSEIFKNINFEILKGDRVGIIGESGVGKTTLANLIIGFLSANLGKILVNDIEVDKDLKSWNKMISYIPQDGFLFGGNIKTNITLEESDKTINFDKLNSSIKKSKIDFEDKIENIVNKDLTDGGDNISGGQKQRVSLARIFYFDSEIIILDEPTSALDSKTEDYIISALNEIENDKTIFVIAHNSKVIDQCNVKLKISKKNIIYERK